MGRSVTYARLHGNAYAPGVGELGNVFPSQSKTLDGLTMTTTDLGLSMEFSYKGVRHELLVPSANIVIMSLGPAVKSEIKSK